MDFLDPKKERRNHLMLMIGYCLVALAIGIATLILLYQSYGYGVDREGNVTQNGLIFVSSQPTGATIYLNGKRYKNNTNTRVVMPANSYNLRIEKTGYRTWERPITVAGGDVQHFDYPFLFPTTLQASPLTELTANPSIATESPDKRWLILGEPATPGTFTLYDLKNPDAPKTSTLALPATAFTTGTGTHTWTLGEWATDNRHVLLLHTYTTSTGTTREYILLDRGDVAASQNVTKSLSLDSALTVTLFNNRTDGYYVYNPTDKSLEHITANDGTIVSRLANVLAYKTYSDNKILYVTDQAPTGKTLTNQVLAVLQDGQKTISLQAMPAGAQSYQLNLAEYAGNWYVAVSANTASAAYIYRNPQSQVTRADAYPSPWRRIAISNIQTLSFSSNTQFLLVQGGQEFGVYDFENLNRYRYTATDTIDQPQTQVTWMDGNRLQYVSGGKLVVFDYDYRNKQTLVSANPSYVPFFASDYSRLYTLRATGDGTTPALTTAPLTVQ